jgi:hypothetical protein
LRYLARFRERIDQFVRQHARLLGFGKHDQ